MRKEILDLVEQLLRECIIQSPLLDVGGRGAEYQRAQCYDFRSKFEDRGMTYYILDKDGDRTVDFKADAHIFDIPENKRPRTIFCTGTLEHCYDPNQIMRKCYEWLQPEGTILVSAPFLYPQHAAEDYYRFSDTGMKMLCKQFTMLKFGQFGTKEKNDIEYYFVGRKERENGDPQS